MIKRLSVLFFALAFVFTANAQVGQEKRMVPDPNYDAPVSHSMKLEKINSFGELFMHTDYDYAGNNVIPKMLDLADIDGQDNLDPFFVGMRRDNSASPVIPRYITFGYSAFGAPIDVFSAFDPSLSLGWGTTQLCVGGPLDGKALVMAHAGGTSRYSIIDLVNLEPVQPFPSVSFGGNFPDFYYHTDGTIWAMDTNADIFVSTDQGGSFTLVSEVGEGDTSFAPSDGPSENPVYGAGGGKYMATVGGWKTFSQGEDGLYLYRTSDFGSTWTGEAIGLDGYFSVANNVNLAPFFENFGQLNANVDDSGVVHIAINGYGAGVNANRDTVNAFPLLYWNSREAEWLEVSVPEVAFEPSSMLADNRPGNGIGQAYPNVSVTDNGDVVFVIWAAPEYTGAVGSSPINVYPGDGGQYSWTIFYTDLQWVVSTDGGVTWSTPTVLGDASVSETYPSVARRLEVLSNGDVVAHFLYYIDPVPGQSLFNPPSSGNNPQNGAAIGDWMYYSMVVAQLTDVNENPTIVNNFNLEQNYPNPFNPSTTIKYSVAERSNVNIKVYDMLGKEVANLVNTVKEAGSYEVSFNASNLASGMYVYSITAGNFTSSKKMMLMK